MPGHHEKRSVGVVGQTQKHQMVSWELRAPRAADIQPFEGAGSLRVQMSSDEATQSRVIIVTLHAAPRPCLSALYLWLLGLRDAQQPMASPHVSPAWWSALELDAGYSGVNT